MSGHETSTLIECAEAGSKEGLQGLIDAGADVNQSTRCGKTALSAATSNVNINCVLHGNFDKSGS